MAKIRVEIDGVILDIPVHNNAKVIVEDAPEEIHINVTHEGIVIDAVQNGEVVDTECVGFDDFQIEKAVLCEECGEPIMQDPQLSVGVWVHATENGHDRDEDHVARPPEELS